MEYDVAVLTTEESFSVGSVGSVTSNSVTVRVTPPPSHPGGLGRITHPTFGVYDYPIAPDEWVNVDSDVIITPIWSHSRTLTGAASTRWSGSIRDVETQEKWNGRVAMKAPQLRMFIDIWRNPPTAPDYVVWTPNYINGFSYNVQLVEVSAGGSPGITSDYTVLQGDGFVKGPVVLTYRIIEKV